MSVTSSAPDSTSDITPPRPIVMLLAFGGLTAMLAAGYGVLFTIVDDYKTEYGISWRNCSKIVSRTISATKKRTDSVAISSSGYKKGP